MRKLLYVDCCIRGELSRTKRIADAFFSALPDGEYEIERVELGTSKLLPLGTTTYFEREKLQNEGKLSDPRFSLARTFAAADLIVVAAPFWDMGLPAILKTYFEHVSIASITFRCDENGVFSGLCNAEKLLLFTTRGMEIPDGDEMEQASPYLKALCRFFGIGGFETVSAWGLDVVPPAEADRRLSLALARARDIARRLPPKV